MYSTRLQFLLQPTEATASLAVQLVDMFVKWKRSPVPELAVLQSLKVIEMLAYPVHTESTGIRNAPNKGLIIPNPFSLCQSLWVRTRQLQIGSEAFYSGTEKFDSFAHRLGLVLKWLLKSSSGSFITDVYAPLTSICMQAGRRFLFVNCKNPWSN